MPTVFYSCFLALCKVGGGAWSGDRRAGLKYSLLEVYQLICQNYCAMLLCYVLNHNPSQSLAPTAKRGHSCFLLILFFLTITDDLQEA